MEDIIIIVWVALIIFGSIINAVNKRRQKAMLEVDEEPKTIVPPIIIHMPASDPRIESLEGESLETIEPETTYAPKPRKRTMRQPTPEEVSKHIEQTKQPHKTPIRTPQTNTGEQTSASKQSEQPQLARDFDLEQAVIYSEILKPKYQDYE